MSLRVQRSEAKQSVYNYFFMFTKSFAKLRKHILEIVQRLLFFEAISSYPFQSFLLLISRTSNQQRKGFTLLSGLGLHPQIVIILFFIF